VRIAEEVIL